MSFSVLKGNTLLNPVKVLKIKKWFAIYSTKIPIGFSNEKMDNSHTRMGYLLYLFTEYGRRVQS